MAFTDHLALVPFTPRTARGSGFLPPILRSMGHVLYLVGCIADEAVTVEEAQALDELRAAKEHWDARVESENLSSQARERGNSITLLFADAISEYPGWEAEARQQNLRDLANRLVAFGAELDRELVGITGSDPGSSL